MFCFSLLHLMALGEQQGRGAPGCALLLPCHRQARAELGCEAAALGRSLAAGGTIRSAEQIIYEDARAGGRTPLLCFHSSPCILGLLLQRKEGAL